ncbi:MAG: hypothetical protein R2836_00230 [Chitinophagales bacterium]
MKTANATPAPNFITFIRAKMGFREEGDKDMIVMWHYLSTKWRKV